LTAQIPLAEDLSDSRRLKSADCIASATVSVFLLYISEQHTVELVRNRFAIGVSKLGYDTSKQYLAERLRIRGDKQREEGFEQLVRVDDVLLLQQCNGADYLVPAS
jgi:hypothetical protein